MSTKFYKSKKFWYAVTTAVAVVLSEVFGVPETTTYTLAGIGISLIFGQAAADWGKESAKIDKD